MQRKFVYVFDPDSEGGLAALRVTVRTVNMLAVGERGRLLNQALELWDKRYPAAVVRRDGAEGKERPPGADDLWNYYKLWPNIVVGTSRVEAIPAAGEAAAAVRDWQALGVDKAVGSASDGWAWQEVSLRTYEWDQDPEKLMAFAPYDLFRLWGDLVNDCNPGLWGNGRPFAPSEPSGLVLII